MGEARGHITLPELRGALMELILCASPFIRSFGRGRSPAQENLLRAMNQANAIAKLPVQDGQVSPDPDALVRAFILANGDWRGLVAAVNRNSLRAADQRFQHAREEQDRVEKPSQQSL